MAPPPPDDPLLPDDPSRDLAEEEAPVESRSLLLRLLLWVVVGAVTLALVLGALVASLDTGPGRRLVAEQIARLAPGTGLRVSIGRIEGSIYGRMTLRDLRLSDPQGLFLESPSVTLDWQPSTWLSNRLQINELSASLVRLHRLPRLRPDPDGRGAILPRYDIGLGKLRIDRLWLGAPIAGTPRAALVIGEGEIRSGRALVRLAARMRDGGDRLAVILDAAPDRDRFDLEGAISAPAGGILARLWKLRDGVELRVSGDGSWRSWKGAAHARSGTHPLLDLSLTNASGQFDIAGTAMPSPLLHGKLQRLTAPRVLITSTMRVNDRRFDIGASVRSSALQVDAAGVVDLRRSLFEGLDINALLLKPEALFSNMRGRDIRLRMTVAGSFGHPGIDYAITSPLVFFDNTGFETVRISGRATLSGPRKTIPATATARRVIGAGDLAESILSSLRIEGPLYLEGQRLSADRLQIHAAHANGRGALAIDLGTGRYVVAVNGQIPGYELPGVGLVDVRTELKAVPGAVRGAMLSGTAHADVRRLDNGLFRNIAGGLPTLDTRIARGADGVVHLLDMKLNARRIQLEGDGQRRRDGSVHIDATGRHDSYGAVVLALEGDIAHPRVDLALPRPHLGAYFHDVLLRMDPDDRGWRYGLRGGSVIGPFTSNGRITAIKDQPTVIDVARLSLGGTTGRGRLRSLPGGLAGDLTLAGGGVDGSLHLAPANGVQRVESHLVLRRARFPGPPVLFVSQGRIDAVALLRDDGPTIEGTLAAQRVRYGKMILNEISTNTRLVNGTGTIAAKLAGTANIPFSFDARLAVRPLSITLSGSGALERRPITLASPAVMAREGDDWVLRDAKVEYAGGDAVLSGRLGTMRQFSARLNALDLSILNLFNPRLGLSGKASGDISYEQPAAGRLPKGRVTLTVRGLSRSGLAMTSTPVDLGIAALLDGRAGAMRAIVRSKGRIIGRVQGRISPIPGESDDPLLERLYAAPLFAQIRYNGPFDALWRLTGIETVDISGPAQIAADFGGRFGEPMIKGVFRTDDARLESPVVGTVVTGLKAGGRFDGSRLVIPQFSGATPKGGGLTGNAVIDLAAANGFGLDIAINADNARLIDRDDLRADITGPLRLHSDGSGGLISGNVSIRSARFRLGRASAGQVPRLDVREVNQLDDDEEEDSPSRPWKLDIHAAGRNQVMVTGMGLDSEWRTDLNITGIAERPEITGSADLVRGSYSFAGKRFDLTRGQIRFTGGYPPDPTLDIVAEASVQGLSANIRVGGTGQQPDISFASVPSLPEDEVLSRLLFGTSVANLSAPEALQLAGAVATIRKGGASAGNPLNKLGRAFGIDRIRIVPADQATGQGTSVAAGKYIGRRVYVEVASDAQNYSATQIEVEMTRWLSVLSKVSTLGQTSVNVKISKDY